MATSPLLKALGLSFSQNPLELPLGSLTEASNCIIRRDDIIESRRGYKIYDTGFGSPSDRAKQLATYKNRILVHYSNKLAFDTGTTDDAGLAIFDDFSGTYSETQSGLRIKSIESNGNFYFTTSEGIQKISAASASDLTNTSGFITPAGGIKAIDLTAEPVYSQGNISGFLTADSAVAYRAVWATRDKNNNLILGSPSQSISVYSSLLTVILQDFVNLLNGLDSVNQSGSLITDGNYVSSLWTTPGLTLNSTALELRNQLVNTATKIDQDIKYANDTGTGVPLTISSASVTSNVCTVTFTGSPSTYFVVGDKINLSGFTGLAINGNQTVSSVDVTPNTITFPITVPDGSATITGAYIESYNFRSITTPGNPSDPATHTQLAALQTYYSAILSELQAQQSGVLSTTLINNYLSFVATTSSNVKLTVTIPEDVNSNYFLQLYRTSVAEATGAQVLSTDVAPGDEMQLVYEGYPSAAELAALQMIVTDITPDSFRGANLYTNAQSGEGILQSNEIPPFAKDINKFKNVAFYANTRTKHKKIISLLGVSSLVTEYDAGNNPSLTITNRDGTFNTYRFVKGVAQVADITTTSGATLDGKYFTLNSANNESLYYIWFDTGASVDPAVSGRTGVKVVITAGDTAAQVATKLSNTLSTLALDFTISVTGSVVTVQNLDVGYTDSPGVGDSGFSISVTTSGVGEKVTQEITNITCLGDGGGSLNNLYFTLNTAFDQNQYYVWYDVSGAGVDPAVSGKTGIRVSINSGDSASTVALATGTAIASYFDVEVVSDVLTITNISYGPCADATAGTSGFTVNIAQQGALDVLLSDLVSPSQSVDETARSLVRIINKNRTENVYAYYLSGSDQVPGQMVIEARRLNTQPFYIQTNNETAGLAFNPDLGPILTISSISTGTPSTMLITTSTPHGLINKDKVIISGSDCVPSIDGHHEISYVSSTTFRVNKTITTSGTKGGVTKSSAATVTENDDKPNRVYYSKLNQPEAVPLVNYFDVGAMDKAILRIFPLRDTLFVLKEDGLFRISGEVSPFTLSLFDSSCILSAPDSVAVANNNIYAWTIQGIVSITESGVSNPAISRPIDTEVLKVSSSSYTGFKTATWGVGYDSDNSYTVYTVKNPSDTVATIAYRFSNLTNSWTSFDQSKTCGIVNFQDDKVYLGAADINSIEQERKDFARSDYSDREYSIPLTANNYFGTRIRLPDVSKLAVGDVITQSQTLTPYLFNMLLKKIDLDPGFSDNDFESTLSASAGDNMRTKLVELANKIDSDPVIITPNYYTTIASKTGSVTNASPSNPTVISSTGHGLLTGRIINISGSDSYPSINGVHQVTVLDANTFSIQVSVITPGTVGTWATVDNDFRDLQTCYNAIISKINNEQAPAFSNYMSISNTSLVEGIITDVNYVTKYVTLNLALDFIVGDLKAYKAIKTKFTYSPNHFGNPLTYKHFREMTVMFLNKAFTSAKVRVATDLLPQLVEIPFNGDGNGIFGYAPFGAGFFGGGSHPAPFRTYIPRQCQRCRYIVVQFEHNVAREQYGITGMTLTGDEYSTRAYR